jgi:carboxyl-terminal processing protease
MRRDFENGGAVGFFQRRTILWRMRALVWLRWTLLLAAISLFSACQTPSRQPSAQPAEPPRLALETFDEVWRIVNETHFDTNFNGHSWPDVKTRFRPRVAAARSHSEVREIIQEVLKLLDVSHLSIVPGELSDPEEAKGKKESGLEQAEEAESGTLGLEVRYQGQDLVVTHVEPGLPADRAGVRPGWMVRKVGQHDTAQVLAKLPRDLDDRQRGFMAWRSVSRQMSGPPASQVQVEFRDATDRIVKLNLQRTTLQGESIQFGSLPVLYAHLASTNFAAGSASIGVIRFNIWMLPTALAFHRAIDQHRARDGIILDLRGNVGGVVGMIIGVAGHFVTEPITLGTLQARDNTLKLPANPRFADATGRRAEPFGGPVAILVDEITASASEVFTGGLQEHGRVKVFGRTTAGMALPAVYELLPNGDQLYHPVADFITPKGVRFEGRGVIPDVPVAIDRAALLQGRDPVLEAAARWIAAQKSARGTAR